MINLGELSYHTNRTDIIYDDVQLELQLFGGSWYGSVVCELERSRKKRMELHTCFKDMHFSMEISSGCLEERSCGFACQEQYYYGEARALKNDMNAQPTQVVI